MSTQPFSEVQITAFKYHKFIGDPLSHFAHFGSFLSETQRHLANVMLEDYYVSEELIKLTDAIDKAEIKKEFTLIKK
jgi:hypothetical protein